MFVENRTSVNRWTRLLPLIIVAAGILAFANSFSGKFVLDDQDAIVQSKYIHKFWPRPWESVRLPNRWLVDITFAANYATGKLNPADFHATNLLIHILTALFLYGIIRRTLLNRSVPRGIRDSAPWIAFAAVLLWIVHPLQTAGVTYLCQRYESMMGLTFAACFYCFLRARTSPSAWKWHAGVIIAFILGSGTKIVIAMVPVLMVVYDWMFTTGRFLNTLARRKWLYAALFSLIAIPTSILARVLAKNSRYGSRLMDGNPFDYALTQLDVIAHYLRLAFWPDKLCIDYRWPLADGIGDVGTGGVLVLTLVAITLYLLVKRHPLAFAGMWFFIILAPTSSLMPVADAAADHRMYLSLAAVTAIVVTTVWEALRRLATVSNRTWIAPVVFAVMIGAGTIALTARTIERNRDYSDPVRLWRGAVEVNPVNWRARIQLCAELFKNRRFDAVEDCANDMLKQLPDFGRMTVDEVLAREGKPGAEELFKGSDAYSRARDSLGCVAYMRGDLEGAARHYAESVRWAPGNWNQLVNYGLVLNDLGRTNEAVAQWQEAARNPRQDSTPHIYLGRAYAAQGDYAEAIQSYRKVLYSRPNELRVLTGLAWICATCADDRFRDPGKALDLAGRAAKLMEGKSATVQDIIAAAHAAGGSFEDAIKAEECAIEIEASGPSDPASIARLEQYVARLALYREGKAYFDRPSPRTGTKVP